MKIVENGPVLGTQSLSCFQDQFLEASTSRYSICDYALYVLRAGSNDELNLSGLLNEQPRHGADQ